MAISAPNSAVRADAVPSRPVDTAAAGGAATIFEMNVESYRRRVAAARVPRKPRGVSDSKSDSQTA